MRLHKGGFPRGAAFVVCTAFLLLGLGALAASRRLIRFAVQGDSMAPAYAHGDYLVVDHLAYRGRPPRPGDAVIAPDPRVPSRTLLKRVARVDAGGVTLLGDNPGASTDSRHFGPVPLASIAGRVLFRYWRAGRSEASCSSTSASVGNASGGGEAGST